MKQLTLLSIAIIFIYGCKHKETETAKPACTSNNYFLYNTNDCDCPTDGKWVNLKQNCINVENKRYYAELDSSLFKFEGMVIEISDYNLEEDQAYVRVDFFDKSLDYKLNHQEFFNPVGNFKDENYLIKKDGDSLINYLNFAFSSRIGGISYKKIEGKGDIDTHLYGQFIENNQKFRAHFKFEDGKTGKFIDSVTVIFHK